MISREHLICLKPEEVVVGGCASGKNNVVCSRRPICRLKVGVLFRILFTRVSCSIWVRPYCLVTTSPTDVTTFFCI